jgi:SSS family solute:Na+ symporter
MKYDGVGMAEYLTRPDLWVVAIYLVTMLVIAFRVSSGSRDVEGYTVGNRQMSGTVIGLSVLGTFLSSITFLGLPAKTYSADWNAYVFGLAMPLAALIAVLFFVPLYRRHTRLSAYEFLEQRFGRWARIYADCSYLLLQLIRIGTVLLLVAFAAERMLSNSSVSQLSDATAIQHGSNLTRMAWILVALGSLVIVYDTVGGIRAVIWTDVVQVVVLFLGGLWCLAEVIHAWPGGVGDFWASIPTDKLSLGRWTNFDVSTGAWDWGIPSVGVVMIYGLTEHLRNFGTDQNYVQRTLASKSDRAAANGIWIGAISYLPLSLIFCLIGTGLWMLTHQANGSTFPAGLPADQVFPHFIRYSLPSPIAGLVTAAILAAAMSTVDSSLNSCSTILLADVLRPLKLIPRRVPEIFVIRACTVTFGAIGTLSAVILLLIKGQSQSKVLMDLWWQYAGTAGGGLFGLFLLAWLMPRVPSWWAAGCVLLSIPTLVWGTFARDISDPVWQWLECPLHPFLVGVLGTLVILSVGAVGSLFVRVGWLRANSGSVSDSNAKRRHSRRRRS